MSNIKINDLPEKIDNLSDDDLFIIEDSEDTKKIPLIRLKAAFSMDGSLVAVKDMLLEKINTFISSHKTKVQELEERCAQFEVTCANLENNHIHDAERISELENNLIDKEETINTLKEEKNRLLTEILQLQLDKDNLSVDLQTLLKEKTDIENDISTLNSEVETLQNKVSELETSNKELEDTVNNFETASNTDVQSFYDEINTKLSDEISDIMDYIRYYHPDVDSI